jgi:N-acetylglucosamine-6-phosphate deacetylase
VRATFSGINITTGEPVRLQFGKTIEAIHPDRHAPRDLNAPHDLFISPGFVDLQVNGFGGCDFNDPQIATGCITKALQAILATGVTRFLPTIITGPPDAMLSSLANLTRARDQLPLGRMIAGFHVEGPHIGAEDGPRGAHPARWVRPPDVAEFQRWQQVTNTLIRLVTLSPHWPEAPQYIAALRNAGVVVSIGHTSATAEQIAAAVDAGATLSTHLGNAACSVLRKHPNCLWDQLAEDRLSASFIVDGVHLDNAFLRVALRAKGVDRSILVTDAAAPAGATPGPYRLGELDVELTPDGDRVVLAGSQKLAGSSLRMNRAISNVARLAHLNLRDAVQMATANPARLIGMDAGLQPGAPADIVLFRDADLLQIEAVYLDGEQVYRS